MAPSVGDRLGAYELLAPLRGGGQAHVWRARDARLGREVAVKVLHEELAADPVARERFDREARAVAALSHSNILDVHDVGSTGETLWLVTELLEGETLKERIEKGALPWRRSVEIALATSEGLAAAHAQGIIHRDIKPSNVFLTADGRVKILDFGIAALTEDTSVAADQRDLTAPQMIVGTAGYLAPEQLRHERLDARCDIFALGCVLYEMVTGRKAFAGDTPAEALVATLRNDPKDPADLAPDLPSDLRGLILRCLERRPDRRFQSALDLADALRRPFETSNTSNVTAPLPAPVPRPPWPRRAVLVVAAAVVVGLAGWLFAPRRHAAAADRLAVLPFENETGDDANEYLCEGVTSSLIDAVSRTPGLSVIARATVYSHREEQLRKTKSRVPDPRAAARVLGATAVLTGRVKRKGTDVVVDAELVDGVTGDRLWQSEVTDHAGDPIPAAEELAPKIAHALNPSLTPEVASSLAPRRHRPDAWDLVQRGRFFLNKRGEGIPKAKEYFEQAIALDPREAEAYRGLAEVLHLLAYYGFEAPAKLIPTQRELASNALTLDPSLSGAHAILADARYMFDHDWPGAEEEFKKALALNPNDAEAHQWYSNFLTAASRFDEASTQIARARTLDPLNPVIQMDVGLARYWRGDLTGGQKDIRAAIEMDSANALLRTFGALPLFASNRPAEALEDLEKAREREPGNPIVLALRGYAFERLGRAADAANVRKDLDALAKERYVSGFPFAILSLGRKRYSESLDWLEQAAVEGECLLTYLEVEPAFDPLRKDPRFRELVKRLAIPAPHR